MAFPEDFTGLDAVGDIIAGDPPVPITVWRVPAAAPGETVSVPLAHRLVVNFTRGRRLVLDLTGSDLVARAAGAAGRLHSSSLSASTDRRGAALIVAGWPPPDGDGPAFFDACEQVLSAGCCVAVVLQDAEFTVNQQVIASARVAGLNYLQHIVAAHAGRQNCAGEQLRLHSDVLVFLRPPAAAPDFHDG